MAAAAGTFALRDERIGIAAVATAGFGAAAVAARDLGGLHVVCPVRALTGVPCPGCGMTSLASSLATGDVAGAVVADPAGVLLVLVVAVRAAVHLVGRRIPGAGRAAPSDRWLAAAGALALVLHWATTGMTGGALAG